MALRGEKAVLPVRREIAFSARAIVVSALRIIGAVGASRQVAVKPTSKICRRGSIETFRAIPVVITFALIRCRIARISNLLDSGATVCGTVAEGGK